MHSSKRPVISLCALDCDLVLRSCTSIGELENDLPICASGVEELLAEVARKTRAHYQRNPRAVPWISYLVIESQTGQIVGICAFVDAPRNGEVEIAYHIFPPFEGRGFATAAAKAMVDFAWRSPLVRVVIAHTLREVNASTRVLARCGFVQTGEATDADEGTVWRWECSRRGG